MVQVSTINRVFLRNCLRITPVFEFSPVFNNESLCSDNFRQFQVKSKVDFLIEIFIRFSLKGN